MSILEALAIALAGVAAGTINTVVGSGTLITFPTLLAFGVPPVTANVSNTIGLVPGSWSGVVGYRRELAGQGSRVVRLGAASLLGGLAGAVLLLLLPAGAFEAIVPALIALGVVLVVLQPRISAWVARRHERLGRDRGGVTGAWWVWPAILATGVYGGYFGAAQGVILLAICGIAIPEDLQRINALKNVLAGIVNGVAAAVFIVFASVAWLPALLLAAGSAAGGQLGARIGRRLSPAILRGVIVVVGVAAIVQLLT